MKIGKNNQKYIKIIDTTLSPLEEEAISIVYLNNIRIHHHFHKQFLVVVLLDFHLFHHLEIISLNFH